MVQTVGALCAAAAVTMRKRGIIKPEVAVALAMSATHKNVDFDHRRPAIDFDSPELARLPEMRTSPVKIPDLRSAHLSHVAREE